MHELSEELKQAASNVAHMEINERPRIEDVATLKAAVDAYIEETLNHLKNK